MKILICCDGSADAHAATERAGLLMPGSDATALVVWETILETMTGNGSLGIGFGLIGEYGDSDTDVALERAALETATDGGHRAIAAGSVALPRIADRHDDISGAILAVAADVDADIIVLGTRGCGGVMSRMLGSVSHAVRHHAHRPVLAVPCLAGQRLQRAEHAKIAQRVALPDRPEGAYQPTPPLALHLG